MNSYIIDIIYNIDTSNIVNDIRDVFLKRIFDNQSVLSLDLFLLSLVSWLLPFHPVSFPLFLASCFWHSVFPSLFLSCASFCSPHPVWSLLFPIISKLQSCSISCLLLYKFTSSLLSPFISCLRFCYVSSFKPPIAFCHFLAPALPVLSQDFLPPVFCQLCFF